MRRTRIIATIGPASDSPNALDALIAAGKREPEKYTYGTSGVGGSGNLMMIEVDQSHGAAFQLSAVGRVFRRGRQFAVPGVALARVQRQVGADRRGEP